MVVRNNNVGIPTIQGTTWTLAYGTLFSALLALAAGVSWTFDASARYVLSLAYLAVCGSVIAFVTYFALLKRVGPGPSAYTTSRDPGDRDPDLDAVRGLPLDADGGGGNRARRRRDYAGATLALDIDFQ
jgi:hypothetical protein